MPEIIPDTTAVRIKNTWDRPFVQHYANQKYVVPVGGEAIVPYPGICYWFGDPRSIDFEGGKAEEQFRTLEMKRLSVLYGIYDSPFWDPDGIHEGKAPIVYLDDERKEQFGTVKLVDGRHPYLPRIEVWTLLDPEQLFTVIDDPSGERIAPKRAADPEVASLKAMLVQQQQATATLLAQLAERDPNAAAELGQPASPVDLDQITDSLDSDPAVADTGATEDKPTRGRKPRAAATA